MSRGFPQHHGQLCGLALHTKEDGRGEHVRRMHETHVPDLYRPKRHWLAQVEGFASPLRPECTKMLRPHLRLNRKPSIQHPTYILRYSARSPVPRLHTASYKNNMLGVNRPAETPQSTESLSPSFAFCCVSTMILNFFRSASGGPTAAF
jgi:hypothetical protein